MVPHCCCPHTHTLVDTGTLFDFLLLPAAVYVVGRGRHSALIIVAVLVDGGVGRLAFAARSNVHGVLGAWVNVPTKSDAVLSMRHFYKHGRDHKAHTAVLYTVVTARWRQVSVTTTKERTRSAKLDYKYESSHRKLLLL